MGTMNIAIVSSTTIPATLPDDKDFVTTYGSEVYNAVLCKGLADKGHIIDWFAPLKSTTFHNHANIDYHPIINSKGKHLQDERLEKISYRPHKTTDLLDYDFVIDMSKQNHITEDLSTYYDFTNYCQYKSGYQDWSSPRFGPRHFVTHCNTFAEHFAKNGLPKPEVAKFGIPEFWNNSSPGTQIDLPFVESLGLRDGYYLFPHRPSYQKGFGKLVELAVRFPNKTFVISTAAVFEDHIREMTELKKGGMPVNLKIIDIPQDKWYHYHRRALMRNATALLSPFSTIDGYMDTGGLISFEAIRCGCPVVVTRSPSSTEMLGSLEGKGVEFVSDGIDDLTRVLKTGVETRPQVDTTWMSIDSFVSDYERIIALYKSRSHHWTYDNQEQRSVAK